MTVEPEQGVLRVASEHRPTVWLQVDVFEEDRPEGWTGTPDEVALAAWSEIRQWVADGYLPYVTVLMGDGQQVEVDVARVSE